MALPIERVDFLGADIAERERGIVEG